jgi:putative transposase
MNDCLERGKIMSRKPRVWFPGAVYHITSRGNRKAAIFYSQKDYEKYLSLLEETREKYPFLLHAYCLMPNHLHLLLETIDIHIKEIMKMLHSNYATYFNKRYDLVGHVFQGRYGAKLIDSVDYFSEASRYIHLNPVEANLVSSPEQYQWSSYAAYVLGNKNPHVITSKLLFYFQTSENYRKYVESKIGMRTLTKNSSK